MRTAILYQHFSFLGHHVVLFLIWLVLFTVGESRSAVGWGTALQVGRSRVRLPMVSLEFFIDNPSGRTMALGSTQPPTEMNTSDASWGWKRAVRRAYNLTTFMYRLSWNLGASASWNPLGLSRPVMGLLYRFTVYCHLFEGCPYLNCSVRIQFIFFRT